MDLADSNVANLPFRMYNGRFSSVITGAAARNDICEVAVLLFLNLHLFYCVRCLVWEP